MLKFVKAFYIECVKYDGLDIEISMKIMALKVYNNATVTSTGLDIQCSAMLHLWQKV